LGEPAQQAQDMVGGFSPGVAAVVSGATRSLFVKAVGSAVNAESVRLYQLEAEVTSAMPDIVGVLRPAHWADLDVDGQTFAVIAFPALDGSTAKHPWRYSELSPTMEALHRVSRELTPSPWPANSSDERLPRFFSWWERIAANPGDPWQQHAYVASRLSDLISAEERLRDELAGDTLTHTDLRADNIVLGRGGVTFVDWAHAQNAASWVDAAILVGDVIASHADLEDGGEVDVAAMIRTHPCFTGADFAMVWRLLVGLAGALHGISQTPSQPGLPTIRSWQAVTAESLLSWCQREPTI
jgi:hypothetical protein